MIKEIVKEIEKSKNILLTCHPHSDPDSVGSNLALKLALEKMGKKVTLIKGDDAIPKSFKFPGVETILPKNFSEIDASQFDLFLILDMSSRERISQKAEVNFPVSMRTTVIDHHTRGADFTNLSWIDIEYSSTSHMIYDLLGHLKVEIDHDIALNLFMGMYTDTGGFKYGSNVINTLKVAAQLAEIAPDYTGTIFEMENNNTKANLVFEGLALSSLKTFYGDKLAIVTVSHSELLKNNIGPEDAYTGGISNKIKSVEGLMIAATLVETEPGLVKLSMRTRDLEKYDLSKIALALGGGGHKGAAGATLKMSLEDAVKKVAETAKEIYNL